MLTVTQMLRKQGVVGQVRRVLRPGPERAGARRPRDDRQHGARVRRDRGALPGRRRDAALPARYRARRGAGAIWSSATPRSRGCSAPTTTPDPAFTDMLELDLGTVEPSLAGPRRPQDRVALAPCARTSAHRSRSDHATVPTRTANPLAASRTRAAVRRQSSLRAESGIGTRRRSIGCSGQIGDGSVVIAAITSCTNTSNPSVMWRPACWRRRRVERGLTTQPYVKTSLAPGSKVVTEYLRDAGLTPGARGARLQHCGLRMYDVHRGGDAGAAGQRHGAPHRGAALAGGATVFGPTRTATLRMRRQTEMMQGERECVTLVLQDGRDAGLHAGPRDPVRGRTLGARGRARTDRDRVVVGLEAPLDEPGDDEAGYVLRAGEMTLHDGHAAGAPAHAGVRAPARPSAQRGSISVDGRAG